MKKIGKLILTWGVIKMNQIDLSEKFKDIEYSKKTLSLGKNSKNSLIRKLIKKIRFMKGEYYKIAKKYDRDSEALQNASLEYQDKIADLAKNLKEISTLEHSNGMALGTDNVKLIIKLDLYKIKDLKSFQHDLMHAIDYKQFVEIIRKSVKL